MPTSEKAFQAQLIRLAHTFGWRVQHTRPAIVGERWMTPVMGDIGFVDLVLVHRTKGVLFVELKSETGRMRPEQEVWRDDIQSAGGEWYLWRPSDLEAAMKRLSTVK